ncbi:hypothetical protein IWX47DRAFT_880260 [Phyllosticta citricarpa]
MRAEAQSHRDPLRLGTLASSVALTLGVGLGSWAGVPRSRRLQHWTTTPTTTTPTAATLTTIILDDHDTYDLRFSLLFRFIQRSSIAFRQPSPIFLVALTSLFGSLLQFFFFFFFFFLLVR